MSASARALAATAQQASAREFFTAPYFAVSGASTNPERFGHKIFAWYISHGFEATPINPTGSAIKINGQSHAATSDLSTLSNPAQTSLSIVTRPEITMETLKTAQKLGIQRVWLQPDTYDDKVLDFARTQFKTAVYGMDDTHAHDGWCVLVDGESAASAAGRTFKL